MLFLFYSPPIKEASSKFNRKYSINQLSKFKLSPLEDFNLKQYYLDTINA